MVKIIREQGVNAKNKSARRQAGPGGDRCNLEVQIEFNECFAFSIF